MKTGFLITGLVLLLIANIVMIYTRGIGMEGFEAKKNGKDVKKATKMDAKKKAESFVNYFWKMQVHQVINMHQWDHLIMFV
jgi:hypothetical protein